MEILSSFLESKHRKLGHFSKAVIASPQIIRPPKCKIRLQKYTAYTLPIPLALDTNQILLVNDTKPLYSISCNDHIFLYGSLLVKTCHKLYRVAGTIGKQNRLRQKHTECK